MPIFGASPFFGRGIERVQIFLIQDFLQGDAGWVFLGNPQFYPVRKGALGSDTGGNFWGIPISSSPQARPSAIQVTADHIGYCLLRYPQLLRNG